MLDFDEINRLAKEKISPEEEKKNEEFIEDLLLMVYALGVEEIEGITKSGFEVDPTDVYSVLDMVIDGKTFRERIPGESVEELVRLTETEAHRVYETAKHTAAVMSGLPMSKRWITMMDDRVRDTHAYIEGARVPLDAEFYTYDGDKALYPGGFTKPENNIGCRCILDYEII